RREGAHALRLRDGSPVLEQLAPPRQMPARGAREDQRPNPMRMDHRNDLRDDAAHRCTHDVRAVVAGGVEYRERVLGHLFEVVVTRGPVTASDTSIVEHDAAVATTDRVPLEGPASRISAESLDHEDRLTVAATGHVVVQAHAV